MAVLDEPRPVHPQTGTDVAEEEGYPRRQRAVPAAGEGVRPAAAGDGAPRVGLRGDDDGGGAAAQHGVLLLRLLLVRLLLGRVLRLVAVLRLLLLFLPQLLPMQLVPLLLTELAGDHSLVDRIF